MRTRVRSFPAATHRASTSPQVLEIVGRFKTVNTTDPVVQVGRGWSVARSAEGKWVITFKDDDGTTMTYPEVLVCIGSPMLAAAGADAGDLSVHWDPVVENTEASSVTVYLSQDGSDADTPGAWVQFIILVRVSEARA